MMTALGILGWVLAAVLLWPLKRKGSITIMLEVQVGKRNKLKAVGKDAGGNDFPLVGPVTWSVGPESAVAFISEEGAPADEIVIEGVTETEATIVAKADGKVGSLAIAVTAAPPGPALDHIDIVDLGPVVVS